MGHGRKNGEQGHIDDEKSCFCTTNDHEYSWHSRPFESRQLKRRKGKEKEKRKRKKGKKKEKRKQGKKKGKQEKREMREKRTKSYQSYEDADVDYF